MTNLKELSNFELVLDTKKSVLKERQATLAVLDRLREIALRRVHLEMGYSSLHEFCVVELGYSDGAAYRRIHAMELCDELPEAKQAISEGALSLTTAACLESYLEKDGKDLSADQKAELLKTVEGKSKAECERIFYPEKTGKLIQFHADDETLEDLQRLCELLAIAPHDVATLIKRTARIARKAIDPILRKPRKVAEPGRKTARGAKRAASEAPQEGPETASPKKLKRRPLPIALKNAVWLRDGSQCAYTDTLSGRRCSSRYGLQIDHRVPVACGGSNDLENLRLMCFAHNALAARRVFGREKMERYRLPRRPH